MASGGGTGPGPGGRLIYSVQRTYMLKAVATAEAEVLTCDQRIDIPVIEPLANVQAVVYQEQPRTVVPCIEITGVNLNDVVLKFETNEGVTYTPIIIGSGMQYPLENPYLPYRHVLVLPRGTTGIKSCKVVTHAGTEIQNSLTFGVMLPPYNYDNALFGYLSYGVQKNSDRITELENKQLSIKNTAISEASEDVFRVFGPNDDSNIMGWGIQFHNSGALLSLNMGSANVTVFSGIDVTGVTLLALSYDRMSSVCNLYALTEASGGNVTQQRLLASGFCPVKGAGAILHLFIDSAEQSFTEIGTGYIRSLGDLNV